MKGKQKGNKKMNKVELVAAMAEKAAISKKDAEAALNAFTATVEEELKKGEKIALVGFGTFETAVQKGRTGTIQFGEKKGQTYTTEDSVKPVFKAGKSLKESLN